MPSTSGDELHIRPAKEGDLVAVKILADQHRHELGFVLLPSLQEQIEKEEMFVAEQEGQIIGFVDYHIRRDKQLTLYHIAVHSEWQQRGVGRTLLEALEVTAQESGCTCILLKCPVDLVANQFYAAQGYNLQETLHGRKRPLNVWELPLKGAGEQIQ
jgi:N-acetylglutamate synthase-like GNAT family acetyltransferase